MKKYEMTGQNACNIYQYLLIFFYFRVINIAKLLGTCQFLLQRNMI